MNTIIRQIQFIEPAPMVWARHLGVPVEYTNSIGMKFVLIPPGEFTIDRKSVV